jgi:hypothetical protein
VFPQLKKVSQFSSAFLGLSLTASLSFLSSVCALQISAAPLFYSAYDTQTSAFPQAHLLNLEGIMSLSAHLSLDSQTHNQESGKSYNYTYDATRALTFTHNSQILLHGFYISPTFFKSSAQTQRKFSYLSTKGWALSIGRANITYPLSTYRGFVQLAYRQTKADALD